MGELSSCVTQTNNPFKRQLLFALALKKVQIVKK